MPGADRRRARIRSSWSIATALLLSSLLVACGSALPIASESPPARPAGDPARGFAIARDPQRGDCSICHVLPGLDTPFQGDVGPPLHGIGARLDRATLRARLIDARAASPGSIMPVYGRPAPDTPARAVAAAWRGRPILSEQEIEDVVAWLASLSTADAPSISPRVVHPFPTSGSAWQGEQVRALQADDFGNPAALWLDEGRRLWETSPGAGVSSCADCHGAPASLRGLAARLPRVRPGSDTIETLERLIRRCRSERQEQPDWAWESEPLLAMSTLLSAVSAGVPIEIEVNSPSARAALERGRTLHERPRGQLGISCSQCHDQQVGARLRGDVISQGMVDGFPIYRLTWQTMGSRPRMLRWCSRAVRATPFEWGSDDAAALEYWLAKRAEGLEISAPAVRR